jgi:hypothetical protein
MWKITGTKTAAVAIMQVEKDALDRFNEIKKHYETLTS